MTSILTETATEKFHSAEQLWFWFLYSKSVQSGISHIQGTKTRRPCELLDVETLITKLYLCGKLSEQHLQTLKKYGDKRRAPNQYVWAENKDAGLWDTAISELDVAARKFGWIE